MAESSSETSTEPTTSETETTRPVEIVEECEEASSSVVRPIVPEIKCVNDTNASTLCADEVKVEDWVEGDDIVCSKTADVCLKTSNLSVNASPYVKKVFLSQL